MHIYVRVYIFLYYGTIIRRSFQNGETRHPEHEPPEGAIVLINVTGNKGQ